MAGAKTREIKIILTINFLALFLIGVFGAAVFLLGVDVVTSHYRTYEDAVADRLFDRGWLPDFIPSSATGIVTSNDLDLNDSSGEFHYDPADTDSFLANLRPYQGGKNPYVDYEARVRDMESDDYRPYEYMNPGSFWLFFVNVEEGHVIYDMWPNRYRPAEGVGSRG